MVVRPWTGDNRDHAASLHGPWTADGSAWMNASQLTELDRQARNTSWDGTPKESAWELHCEVLSDSWHGDSNRPSSHGVDRSLGMEWILAIFASCISITLIPCVAAMSPPARRLQSNISVDILHWEALVLGVACASAWLRRLPVV